MLFVSLAKTTRWMIMINGGDWVKRTRRLYIQICKFWISSRRRSFFLLSFEMDTFVHGLGRIFSGLCLIFSRIYGMCLW